MPLAWPGRAVALGVVLAAVARAAEAAGGKHGDQRNLLAPAALEVFLLVGLLRPVRLHGAAQVRAAVGDDREARLAVQQAVVPDVGRSARDLARIRMHEERGHEPAAFGEVVERSEVDAR